MSRSSKYTGKSAWLRPCPRCGRAVGRIAIFGAWAVARHYAPGTKKWCQRVAEAPAERSPTP